VQPTLTFVWSRLCAPAELSTLYIIAGIVLEQAVAYDSTHGITVMAGTGDMVLADEV